MIYGLSVWRFAESAGLAALGNLAVRVTPRHAYCLTFLPASLDPLSGYLVVVLVILLGYQQWRLYRFRQEAAKREELFRIVAENAADMIALVDVKGRRLYNSPAYERILGYTPEELAKTPALEQIHPEDRFKVLEAAREARQVGTGKKLQYRLRHKNGTWRILESAASTIKNKDGEVEKLVIVNRDITDRKQSEEQLQHNSFLDPLTRLPNRRLFLDRLRHSMLRAQRYPDYHYAVLLLDIDGFKTINQEMGESAGDQVLTELGRRAEACLRDNDTVARPSTKLPTDDTLLQRAGGDEFAILLESIHDPSDALRTARRIQAAAAVPFSVDGRQVRTSVSIGISLSTTAQDQVEELLEDADIALHRAKGLGGSRCEVFDEGMHTRAVSRLKLETELRAAVGSGQFPVLYQPVINLESKQITGFEALLRWQHPDQGMIPPSKFIDVAESIGLTVFLGKAVIREACAQILAWQSMHRSVAPLNMTVNISGKQFASPDLVKDVRSAIQETRIEPSRLQLEISESVAMANPTFTFDILTQLKHVGVSISIGDFGTSQSSLSLLRRLPIDELKIDRSLVNAMLTDRVSSDIAGLIVTVARSLKLRAVAEGIETSLQLERLGSLGCEFGQGYFFSQPVDPQAVEQLLRDQSLRKAVSAGKR